MPLESNALFSTAVMVPVQAEGGRTVIDWRGIPLAVPFAFDPLPPATRMPIAKRWEESGAPFLKLVHPHRGTTVDYAVRCLFNPTVNGAPSTRLYAFLEIAPHCPGNPPVWTVVERIDRDTIETLMPEAVAAEQALIETIIENRLGVPREAIEAAFGTMSPWSNPDWGDEGNLHLVCTGCLAALRRREGFCAHCGREVI